MNRKACSWSRLLFSVPVLTVGSVLFFLLRFRGDSSICGLDFASLFISWCFRRHSSLQ